MNTSTDSTTVVIGGIETSTIGRAALCELVMTKVPGGQSHAAKLLFDINGQGLAMSLWDARYRADLAAADVVHADGQPLVIASRLLTTTPIAERSATTDLFLDLADAAQKAGSSFFCLAPPSR